jgi:hypothetical protein
MAAFLFAVTCYSASAGVFSNLPPDSMPADKHLSTGSHVSLPDQLGLVGSLLSSRFVLRVLLGPPSPSRQRWSLPLAATLLEVSAVGLANAQVQRKGGDGGDGTGQPSAERQSTQLVPAVLLTACRALAATAQLLATQQAQGSNSSSSTSTSSSGSSTSSTSSSASSDGSGDVLLLRRMHDCAAIAVQVLRNAGEA